MGAVRSAVSAGLEASFAPQDKQNFAGSGTLAPQEVQLVISPLQLVLTLAESFLTRIIPTYTPADNRFREACGPPCLQTPAVSASASPSRRRSFASCPNLILSVPCYIQINSMKIPEAIEKILAREHLTRNEARTLMQRLLSGGASDTEIVSLLTALRDKGEHADELVGFAEVMRAHGAETLRAAGVQTEAFRTGSRCSTLAEQAVTAAGRSTFRRRPRWWRRREECAWRSTATARFRADAEAPTCWRPWVSRSICRCNAFLPVWMKSVWSFFLLRDCTWP